MAKLFDPEHERPIELRRWQAVFERDGNKAAAWRCYRLARAWGLPVPVSVWAEFDRIAQAFDETVERTRGPLAEREDNADTVGLGRDHVGRIVTEAGRGAADPATALLAWERDFAVASAVDLLRYGGKSEKQAVERVANGTDQLAWGLIFSPDGIAFGPRRTPALSPNAVRRAVRRVRGLSTDMTEIAELNNATPEKTKVTVRA